MPPVHLSLGCVILQKTKHLNLIVLESIFSQDFMFWFFLFVFQALNEISEGEGEVEDGEEELAGGSLLR